MVAAKDIRKVTMVRIAEFGRILGGKPKGADGSSRRVFDGSRAERDATLYHVLDGFITARPCREDRDGVKVTNDNRDRSMAWMYQSPLGAPLSHHEI